MFDLFVKRARDPVVYAPSLADAMARLGLTDTTTPTSAQIQTANRGLFSACVAIRARSVASAITGAGHSAGLDVQRIGTAGYAPVEPAHPWRTLIGMPNETRSAYEFWYWASEIRDYMGHADFIVEDDASGMPIALYEVYTEFGIMRPVPSPRGGIKAWRYQRSDGKVLPLEARDVIRLRHPDPRTPYEAVSLIEKAAYHIDIDLYASIYQRDMLADGRYPPAYLSSDQDISQDQAKRYGKEFAQNYLGGSRKKIKGVPVLGSGLSIESTPFRADDLALIDSGVLNDKRIFWCTGVSQGMIDHEANRANVQGQRVSFAELTLQPELNMIASQLTQGLTRAFGAERGALVVRAPNVVPSDRLEQARIDEINIRSGITSPDDVRERDEMGESDRPRFISGMLRPLEDFSSAPSPTEEGGERGMTLVHIGRLRRRGIVLTDEMLEMEWRAVDEEREDAVGSVADAARALFEEQRDELTAAIISEATSRGLDDVPDTLAAEDLISLDDWISATLARLGPGLQAALEHGFTIGSDRISVTQTFEVTERVTAVLDEMGDHIAGVPVTTIEEINRVIASGLTDGITYAEIADQVKDSFDDFSEYRAARIAQTSGTAAFEAGQNEAFVSAGIARHRWLSQRDGNARPAHDTADGQERPLDEPFDVGGEQLRFPCDPAGRASNTVNCRCTVLPILSESDRFLDLSRFNAQERQRIEQSVRDRDIRIAYPPLKEKHGRDVAWEMLSAKYHTSVSNVRRILGLK